MKEKKKFKFNRKRLFCGVVAVVLALCCFSSSVSAYVASDLSVKNFDAWNDDVYDVKLYENVYWLDFEVEEPYINDNGVQYEISKAVDTNLVGPERVPAQVTFQTSFYLGELACSWFSLPNYISAPNVNLGACWELVDCYSAVDYIVSDGKKEELKQYKVSHSGSWSTLAESLQDTPGGELGIAPEWNLHGFSYSPIAKGINIDFGRPVFLNMVTTYYVFNFYFFDQAEEPNSKYDSYPVLLASYNGKGVSYMECSATDVYSFGLVNSNITIGEAIKNYSLDVEDLRGSLNETGAFAVAGVIRDLLGVSLLRNLLLIGLSAAIVSAFVGVAVYFGKRKGGSD